MTRRENNKTHSIQSCGLLSVYLSLSWFNIIARVYAFSFFSFFCFIMFSLFLASPETCHY